MKIIGALLVGMAALVASPALAQDYEQDEQDQRAWPADSFSGPRVEVLLGWDHFANKSLKDIDTSAELANTASGLTYGGAVGYDTAVAPNLLLGAELSVTGSTARWSADTVTSTFNTTNLRIGRDIFVGGRIGYALSPRTLLYGKAGYTNTLFSIDGANSGEMLNHQSNSAGFRIGTGLEQRLTKKTYVKLEYDFSHYGSGQFNYAGSTPDGSNFALKDDRHQVLVGIGLRF